MKNDTHAKMVSIWTCNMVAYCTYDSWDIKQFSKTKSSYMHIIYYTLQKSKYDTFFGEVTKDIINVSSLNTEYK
jgi:hypothetical protein